MREEGLGRRCVREEVGEGGGVRGGGCWRRRVREDMCDRSLSMRKGKCVLLNL